MPSIDRAIAKERTAASSGVSTGLPEGLEWRLAAVQVRLNLQGGLPIGVLEHVIGSIGVGSGTTEQDAEVARAGVGALAGAKSW